MRPGICPEFHEPVRLSHRKEMFYRISRGKYHLAARTDKEIAFPCLKIYWTFLCTSSIQPFPPKLLLLFINATILLPDKQRI